MCYLWKLDWKETDIKKVWTRTYSVHRRYDQEPSPNQTSRQNTPRSGVSARLESFGLENLVVFTAKETSSKYLYPIYSVMSFCLLHKFSVYFRRQNYKFSSISPKKWVTKLLNGLNPFLPNRWDNAVFPMDGDGTLLGWIPVDAGCISTCREIHIVSHIIETVYFHSVVLE